MNNLFRNTCVTKDLFDRRILLIISYWAYLEQGFVATVSPKNGDFQSASSGALIQIVNY